MVVLVVAGSSCLTAAHTLQDGLCRADVQRAGAPAGMADGEEEEGQPARWEREGGRAGGWVVGREEGRAT